MTFSGRDVAEKERMCVRRHGAGCYEVTDKAKGHTYLVRFTRANGATFGKCAGEAGTPRRGRTPMIPKHLFAAVVTHNAIAAMRRAPEALAASPVAHERAEAMGAGADGYLVKPVDFVQVVERAAELIAAGRAQVVRGSPLCYKGHIPPWHPTPSPRRTSSPERTARR